MSVLPFETRAALLAWLDANDVAHVVRLNFEALERFVEPSMRASLKALGGKKRLIELASREQLERSKQWVLPSAARTALEGAVLAFIEAEVDSTRRARAGVAERLSKAPPQAGAVFEALLGLRARLPQTIAPREVRSTEALRVDVKLPGFLFRDSVPSETRPTGSFARAEVRLTLAPPSMKCSCGFAQCGHLLAAIDTALLWAGQSPNESFIAEVAQLTRPAWERTLETLNEVFEHDPASTGFAVKWGVRMIDTLGVEVAALIRRGASKWVELPKWQLLQLHGSKLSGPDSRLASLLPGPDDDSLVPRVFLEALVDAPNVVLRDSPERSVRVDRATVGLVAEERLGSVHVRPGVDGAVLPESLGERARTSGLHEALFTWDEGPRRLTLLEVKPELRTVLTVLHPSRGVFPAESHLALLGSLSKWAAHLPVSMPRSVMGESVPASLSLVLRLHAEQTGGVALEIRVRALPDGAAMVPGEGGRDVHVRRGDKAVHALRDLKAEVSEAEALCAALPLARAEPLHLPFQFRFETAHGALDVLEAVSQRSPPVELEWVGKPLRTVGARGAGALRVVLEKRREWFGLLGELHVFGERVELARLIDAARRKDRYLQVDSHSYVELTEALRLHVEQLSDHVHTGRHGLEVGPSAMGVLQALETIGAQLEADSHWRQLEARMAAAQALTVEVPASLKAELRGYQREGFRWLATLAAWGAGGVLADDMGLGKTLQALTLLLHRSTLGPALVVAPTSVAFNWREEAARFAPSLRLTMYADEGDREKSLSALKAGDVLIISYGLLVRDIARLAAVPFATAVFDEAQGLKNSKTQRFRAARQLKADFKCALSGTPVENHLGELWSLYAIIFPTLFGSWDTFRGRYAVPIEKQFDPAAAPALSRVLAPFMLRRTKAQVETELPARIEVRVPVILSSAEWHLYEDARLAALSDLETPKSTMREQERRIQVLAALTRLRLIASHPKLHDAHSKVASSKLARLLELVDELRAEGHRALIFSQFTTHLALVREALEARGLSSVYLDGQTPREARAERVHAFQNGEAPLFLISLKAGGFGLNLTAASTVIHLDPWWNPAVEDQASDRAHRLGQTKPVTIFRMISMGTIEEEMLSLHASKRALINQVLEGTEQAATFSTQALVELISKPTVEHERRGT